MFLPLIGVMAYQAPSGNAAGSVTIDTATYTRGTAGVAPDLATTVSSTGTTTANYTLYWATRSTGTALSKTDIENGTGDALDNGTVVAATLAGLDDTLDLATSLTSGAIDLFIRDSSGAPVESAVASVTGVTYDAVAPGFSSAVVENAAPSNLVITLTKATYEAGTLAPADFTLGGTYGGSISTATLTDTTTITLGLSTPVVNGDTLTVALTDGTVLVGVDAEAIATWTAQSVTNNVSAGGAIELSDDFSGYADNTDLTTSGYQGFYSSNGGAAMRKQSTPTRAQIDVAATGEFHILNSTDLSSANHYVEIDHVFTNGNSSNRMRLILGATGTEGDGFYVITVLASGSIELSRVVGFTATSLAGPTSFTPPTTGTAATYRLSRSSDTFTVSVDGSPIISGVSDSTYPSGLKVGFGHRLAAGESVGNSYTTAFRADAL